MRGRLYAVHAGDVQRRARRRPRAAKRLKTARGPAVAIRPDAPRAEAPSGGTTSRPKTSRPKPARRAPPPPGSPCACCRACGPAARWRTTTSPRRRARAASAAVVRALVARRVRGGGGAASPRSIGNTSLDGGFHDGRRDVRGRRQALHGRHASGARPRGDARADRAAISRVRDHAPRGPDGPRPRRRARGDVRAARELEPLGVAGQGRHPRPRQGLGRDGGHRAVARRARGAPDVARHAPRHVREGRDPRPRGALDGRSVPLRRGPGGGLGARARPAPRGARVRAVGPGARGRPRASAQRAADLHGELQRARVGQHARRGGEPRDLRGRRARRGRPSRAPDPRSTSRGRRSSSASSRRTAPRRGPRRPTRPG